MKAEVGESPTLHFTVESQLPLAEDIMHTLKTKDGNDVTERFSVKDNRIKFREVRKEDSGTYTISCSNEIVTVKSNLKLEIVGKPVSQQQPYDTCNVCYCSPEKPVYKFENNGHVKAEVGESTTLDFTVESQPPLPGDVKHILKTKDGEDVPKRFLIEGGRITFREVRKEDCGTYTISCSNKVGRGESILYLEVIGKCCS